MRKWKRRAAGGAAALASGTLVAVTAGLAAPAVLAGVAARPTLTNARTLTLTITLTLTLTPTLPQSLTLASTLAPALALTRRSAAAWRRLALSPQVGSSPRPRCCWDLTLTPAPNPNPYHFALATLP